MNIEGQVRDLIREELKDYTENIMAELAMREQLAFDMKEYQKSEVLGEVLKVMEAAL